MKEYFSKFGNRQDDQHDLYFMCHRVRSSSSDSGVMVDEMFLHRFGSLDRPDFIPQIRDLRQLSSHVDPGACSLK